MTMRKFAVLLLAALAAQAAPLHAGSDLEFRESATLRDSPFARGGGEVQVAVGPYGSFAPDSSDRPSIDLVYQSVRVGWMLNSPGGSGFLRGNAEFLLQLFAGEVISGPGTGLVGTSFLLRYNFVQPEARLVPYFQLGGGVLWNDIHEDSSQRLIGQAFEFDLEASLGLRWLISDHWHLLIEGGYRHISNNDRAERNTGLDSLGAMVGVGAFF